MDHLTTTAPDQLNGHPASVVGSPEQLFEQRIARLYEECDNLMILASDPDQWPLFKQERLPLLQTLLRVQSICWKLTGDDIEPLQRLIVAAESLRKAPTGLRMVRNG